MTNDQIMTNDRSLRSKKTEWIRAFGIHWGPSLLAIGVRNIFFPQLHVAYDILIWLASNVIYSSIKYIKFIKKTENPITKADYEEKIEILIAEGTCTREEVNKWNIQSAYKFLGADFVKKFTEYETTRMLSRTFRILLSIFGIIFTVCYIIIMIWYIFSSVGPSSRSAVFFPYFFSYWFFACLTLFISARLHEEKFQSWMGHLIFLKSRNFLYLILALAVGSISSIWYFWL